MSAGDRVAFGEYVRSRSQALLRAAQAMTGNRTDAEDLLLMSAVEAAERIRVACGGLTEQLRVGRVIGGRERLRPGAPRVGAARLVMFRRRPLPSWPPALGFSPVPSR